MRILIASTNAVGDTFLSAAAVAPLRRLFPDARVDLVTNDASAPVAALLPFDGVIAVPFHGLRPLVTTLRRLRAQRYDLVLTFFPGKMNAALHHGTAAQRKLGFARLTNRGEWHARPAKRVAKGFDVSPAWWDPSMPFLALVAVALEPLGIRADEVRKPTFALPRKPEPMSEPRTAVLHATSRAAEKSLTWATTVRVAELLLARGFDKVRILGVADAERRRLADHARRADLSVEGLLSIPDLVAAIVSSGLFVGVDSFPLHVADAYGVRLLGVFGPTSPQSCLDHPESGIRFEVASLQQLSADALTRELDRRL